MQTLLEMVAYIYDYCKNSDFCVFIHYYILIALLYTEYFSLWIIFPNWLQADNSGLQFHELPSFLL